MAEKEVYFAAYCPRCEYRGLEEAADPCDECLAQPVNEDSHKPLYFKEASKATKKVTKKPICVPPNRTKPPAKNT